MAGMSGLDQAKVEFAVRFSLLFSDEGVRLNADESQRWCVSLNKTKTPKSGLIR